MKKNVANQRVSFSLFKAGARIAAPTKAIGDFKVDLSGAGQANVTTLPADDGAGLVTWLPTAAETNADVVTLLCLDALGAEWEPLTIVFYTETDTSVASMLAGVHLDTTQPAITWAQQTITTAAGDALTISATGANGDGVAISGNGTGAGVNIDGGATGYGVDISAPGNNGLQVEGVGGGTYGAEFLGGAIGVRMEGATDYGAQFAGGIAPTDPSFAQLVWTYATRTLTSLGALLASICLAVWTYATRTLTSNSTAPGAGLTAQSWTVLRGDTLSRTFATIAADAGITKCQLTVKTEDVFADTGAILAVDSTTGLLRLNGAAPGAFTATFVFATGVLTVPATTMAQIDQASFYYDVQVWHGAIVTTIERGTFKLVNDVTRTITP